MRFLDLPMNNPEVQGPIEDAIRRVNSCGPSREFDIVKVKLQEALLWLKLAERAEKDI